MKQLKEEEKKLNYQQIMNHILLTASKKTPTIEDFTLKKIILKKIPPESFNLY